jgi:segregation and condensation protein A
MSETEVAYQVKIDVFEGPFDLLLAAIDDGQLEIHKVSLSEIVDSYFAYWQAAERDLIMAADFVFIAAYLIELKSRSLLPARETVALPEELTGVEEALVSHLQEYEVYKKIALDLKQRKEMFDRIYGRHEGEKVESEIELKDLSLRDLVLAFQKVYKEAVEREKVVAIKAEEITLEDRIVEIKRLVAGRSDGLPFEDLFLRKTRLEVVVTFLAILELAKQRAISIRQGRRFGSILIFSVGLIEDGNEQS